MESKKKTTKVKEKSEKLKKDSLSEGNVETKRSCKTCHFSTATVENDNGYCKRHREYIRSLIQKGILTHDKPFCKLWHTDLR